MVQGWIGAESGTLLTLNSIHSWLTTCTDGCEGEGSGLDMGRDGSSL